MQIKYPFILTLLAISIFGCNNEKNIEGHWHIYSEEGIPYHFATLDIGDTSVFWDNIKNLRWAESKIDEKQKTIILLPMEIHTEYQYSLVNDTLNLLEKNNPKTLFGIRKRDCNLEADYFATSMVNLSLPLMDNSILNEDEISDFEFHLLVGKPKKALRKLYGDSTKLEVSGKFITLQELPLANEKYEIKIPENRHDKISTVFFVDKNVLMTEFSEILKAQRSINNRKIFLVGKSKIDSKQISDLRYFPIKEELLFNDGDTVEKWIKAKK